MDISPELVARMEALVRAIDDVSRDSVLGQSGYASEARAIVALLPKPVDPDLLEAREIVASCAMWFCSDDGAEIARNIRSGAWDETNAPMVPRAYAAIKRGRELAAKDAS